jgi:hypothetical protein
MKVTGCAAVSAGFGIANIIGPQTFQARDAPEYVPLSLYPLHFFLPITV